MCMYLTMYMPQNMGSKTDKTETRNRQTHNYTFTQSHHYRETSMLLSVNERAGRQKISKI